MSAVWTQKALADLDAIFDAIAADRPRAAERVIRTLLGQGEALSRYPRRGRMGRLSETRELVVPRLPYMLVCSLRPSATSVKPDVAILRVIHGAMRWPPVKGL